MDVCQGLWGPKEPGKLKAGRAVLLGQAGGSHREGRPPTAEDSGAWRAGKASVPPAARSGSARAMVTRSPPPAMEQPLGDKFHCPDHRALGSLALPVGVERWPGSQAPGLTGGRPWSSFQEIRAARPRARGSPASSAVTGERTSGQPFRRAVCLMDTQAFKQFPFQECVLK